MFCYHARVYPPACKRNLPVSEVDVVFLVILSLAALIGTLKGFLREVMSLLIWLAAILITLFYTSRFASVLPIDMVNNPQTRATLSASVLFAGTLFIGNLINWIVGRVAARRKLAPPDRILGAVFAIARALVVITLLVLAAHLVPDLRQSDWWQESKAIPVFQKMAQFVHARLPDGTWQYFDFPMTGN